MEKNLKTITYLLVFSFLLILPLVSADYPEHKQNTNFSLTITSNNATQCNLSSIQYPDGTQNVFNIELTQDGTTFYTTIDSSNYSQIGNTCHLISCTDGTQFKTGNECRKVTPSGFGFKDSIGFYVLILGISLSILALGYYVQDAWIIMFGGVGLVLVGLYTIIYGIVGLKDTAYTWGVGVVTMMLGSYFLVMASIEKINE